jgi:uncharacterized membrane protein YkvA (DUF1232 family)
VPVRALLTVAAVLVGLWLLLLVGLAVARPDGTTLAGAVRLLPDTLRLVRRLATDRSIPRSARAPVWFLLAYLAMPIDLVPDVIPVLGYADDAVLVVLVLRRLVRRAGPEKLAEHWPGDAEGLASLRRLLRIDPGGDGDGVRPAPRSR